MSKISARSVPQMLTDDQKRTWLDCSRYLLSRFEDDLGDLTELVVTQDETWVHHFDPVKNAEQTMEAPFLAHRIRISEILPWDRKSYLTQAILARLSREGYIHWLYWNSRTWSSNDVIVMLKCRHHVK